MPLHSNVGQKCRTAAAVSLITDGDHEKICLVLNAGMRYDRSDPNLSGRNYSHHRARSGNTTRMNRSVHYCKEWIRLAAIATALIVFQTADGSGENLDLPAGSTTVLFYMNGDNDLTDEVLSAVDHMESVGSSAGLNAVALVDGHPGGAARFGKQWTRTYLLHITEDDRLADINSTVLADWGEQDLGDPDTLKRFVREAIRRFPADRYIFCAFAHGKGVIDTGNLSGKPGVKTLFISTDSTSRTVMPLHAFADALKSGLDGRRFSLMVLFSCLSSMIEIAYELGDVTDYLIASEDEIRLVNEPAGTHQLRGIFFEDLLQHLETNPSATDIELGRQVIERFVEPYSERVESFSPGGRRLVHLYPAGLALVDCRSVEREAAAIDILADRLIKDLNQADLTVPTLAALQTALGNTPTYKSFLNLQYYDLPVWLDQLGRATASTEIRRMCRHAANLLTSSVIVFERHNAAAASNGMAIFFNHHLVPENIAAAHLAMYRQTRFSRDTRWDELLHTYRRQMWHYRAELLLARCRQAYLDGNRQLFQQLSRATFRAYSRMIDEGRWEEIDPYISFLDTLPAAALSPQLKKDLANWLAEKRLSPQARSASGQLQRILQRSPVNR